MNRIKARVSRETNYIYHMLSVAGCGYDNDYGKKYAHLHAQEDLALLKQHEQHITVSGGEHCGRLYWPILATPASLDDPAVLFFEATEALFSGKNVRENALRYQKYYEGFMAESDQGIMSALQAFYDENVPYAAAVCDICSVMARNYDIYCSHVWEESKAVLLPYAAGAERVFDENGLSDRLEALTNEKYANGYFYASFCNSMEGGAEAIDISPTQDVFGIARDYVWAEKFIGHEFVIYLLKQVLAHTGAMRDMKLWPYTEGLAEFYLTLAGRESDGGAFDRLGLYIDFYRQVYAADTELSALQLFEKAVTELKV